MERLKTLWRRHRRLTVAGLAIMLGAIIGTIVGLSGNHAQAGTLNPPATTWHAPEAGQSAPASTGSSISATSTTRPTNKPTPVPSHTSASPVAPPSSPAAAPPAPPPDAGMTETHHIVTQMWQQIVNGAPKDAMLNLDQRNVPTIKSVGNFSCQPWQYEFTNVPEGILNAIRWCDTSNAIEVQDGTFLAIGNNGQDDQLRGVAAAWVQFAYGHLSSPQKTYGNGKPRPTNAILANLQYVVWWSLTNGAGLSDQETYVVMDAEGPAGAGSVMSYFAADQGSGQSWAA